METVNTPTAALPCPFCGNPPELTYMPIELYNGCIPTRERPAWMIRCASLSCLGPSAHSERSEADAIEKWNRRAPAVQATADADEAARDLVSDSMLTAALEAGFQGHEADLQRIWSAMLTVVREDRKAVSPKAARPQWVKEADCLLDRVAYELSQASMSAKVSDYMRAEMKRWSQALKEFRLVHLQPSSPPAVSVGEQEKERE